MTTPHRDIFLLRHAHADAQVAGQSDFDRPLSELGRKQAAAAAQWLVERLPEAARVLCSPALRTQQTFDALQQLRPQLNAAHEAGIYEASPGTLLMLLDREFDAKCVVLIGHNPGLESAVALLSAGRSNEARGMPVAAVAHLRVAGERNIEPGAAELVAFWSP